MSATTMTLDYELPKDVLLTEWKKSVSQTRQSWRSRLPSLAALGLMIHHWGNVPWWMTGLEVGIAASMWWMPRLILWLVMTFAYRSRPAIPCRIEIDGHGLSFENPGSGYSPSRFQWSNLTEMNKTDFGIELQFRRRLHGAMIPWLAFRDDEHTARFLQLVGQYLPAANSSSSALSANMDRHSAS